MNNSIEMNDITHSRVSVLIDLSDDLSITSRNSCYKKMKLFHIIIPILKKCKIFEEKKSSIGFFQKLRNY